MAIRTVNPAVLQQSGGQRPFEPVVSTSRIAEALMRQGYGGNQIETGMEAVGNVATQLTGAFLQKKAEERQQRKQDAELDYLNQLSMALTQGPQEPAGYSQGGQGPVMPADVSRQRAMQPLRGQAPSIGALQAGMGMEQQMLAQEAAQKAAQRKMAVEDRNFALNIGKFDETKRHNRAVENKPTGANNPTIKAMLNPATGEEEYGRWKNGEFLGFTGQKPYSEPSAAEQKIKRIRTNNPEIDGRWAQAVADGLVDFSTDGVTGDTLMLNKLTQEQKRIPKARLRFDPTDPLGPGTVPRREPAPMSEKTQGELLERRRDHQDLRRVFGDMGPIVEAAGGNASDLAAIWDGAMTLFGTEHFPENKENRHKVRLMSQSLKRVLNNNPRFPVYEMKLIEPILNNPNKFFQLGTAERVKFEGIMQLLDEEVRLMTNALYGEPVEQQETGGIAPSNLEKPIPQAAIDELLADPTDENKAYFDAIFNEGSADRVINGQ